MNAALLILTLVCPGQAHVFHEAPPVPELTPAVRAQHAKALAELRAVDREEQLDRMIEDVEVRMQWVGDRQMALVELIGFESGLGTWGKPGEFGGSTPRRVSLTAAGPDEPREARLEERFKARRQELVRAEKQNRNLIWQRQGVRQHLDRQADRQATIAAAGMLRFDRPRGH